MIFSLWFTIQLKIFQIFFVTLSSVIGRVHSWHSHERANRWISWVGLMSSRLGHGSIGRIYVSGDPHAVSGNVNRHSWLARALHSYALFICHTVRSEGGNIPVDVGRSCTGHRCQRNVDGQPIRALSWSFYSHRKLHFLNRLLITFFCK